MTEDSVVLDSAEKYSGDIYTDSFGAGIVAEKLQARYGQRYTDYRQTWARAEALELQDFPVNLVFDLIDGCNLACPQCLRSVDLIGEYEGFLNTRKKLAFEEIVRALDEGYDHNLPSVNIGGSGECTLHPDFIKICGAVMERDIMELRLVTNGLRLTEEINDALIDQQVHMLSVSIDAFSPETFGVTRGKSHRYQSVVDNTLALLESRNKARSIFPLVRVSFVNQPANRHELDDFVEFWSKRADMVDVQGFMDFRATEFSTDFDCNEPWRRLNIWADGHVGPCCGFPGIQYDIGQFREETLHEIWHGPKMKAIRKMLSDKAFEKPCLQCLGGRSVNT
jgi:radical SAM protein with 4Fe4S-binding SPASM domain